MLLEHMSDTQSDENRESKFKVTSIKKISVGLLCHFFFLLFLVICLCLVIIFEALSYLDHYVFGIAGRTVFWVVAIISWVLLMIQASSSTCEKLLQRVYSDNKEMEGITRIDMHIFATVTYQNVMEASTRVEFPFAWYQEPVKIDPKFSFFNYHVKYHLTEQFVQELIKKAEPITNGYVEQYPHSDIQLMLRIADQKVIILDSQNKDLPSSFEIVSKTYFPGIRGRQRGKWMDWFNPITILAMYLLGYPLPYRMYIASLFDNQERVVTKVLLPPNARLYMGHPVFIGAIQEPATSTELVMQ